MTTQSIPKTKHPPSVPSRSATFEPRGWTKFSFYAIVAAVSLLNAGWVLSEAGVTFSRCFAPNDTHRRQAAAMLDGHFWLSRSIFDTQFDNCYVNGKVQQVWGLGVPMYLIPFELFGRAIGVSPFPDRIAMGVMLAAFFFYCSTLLTALPGRGFTVLQAVGITILIAFSPPLLNLLLNGPQNVYEDASVYALLTSLAILIAMLRFIVRRQMRDYWICCFLGGMSGLIRPTHAIYGVLGPVICCILLLRDRRIRAAVVPLVLVVAGMAFLAISNRIRFGAFSEFGHRLTLTNSDGEMTSRFVNPIAAEPPLLAAKELTGALFFAFSDIRKMQAFGRHQFLGQSDCFRWRDFYVTSYDPTVLLLVMLGILAGVPIALSKKPRRSSISDRHSGRSAVISLSLWGAISSMLLFRFMMYYPGLSTRYLYDFWPGFLAAIAAIWLVASEARPGSATAIFACWFAFGLYRMDCADSRLPLAAFQDVHSPSFGEPVYRRLETSGVYNAAHTPPPRLSRSCDFQFGIADYTARLPIDSPRFVELVIGPRLTEPVRSDVYRARIANVELQLVSVHPEPDSRWMRVRFDVPANLRANINDQLLFLCFVSKGDDFDIQSRRAIKSIAWR